MAKKMARKKMKKVGATSNKSTRKKMTKVGSSNHPPTWAQQLHEYECKECENIEIEKVAPTRCKCGARGSFKQNY